MRHNQSACTATLSIYPGFEHLSTDLVAEVALADHRQFAERSLLDLFDAHPCRVDHAPESRVSAVGIRPHFFLIPVPWRAVSLSTRRSTIVHRTTSALSAALNSASFALEPENHFLLSASWQELSAWGERIATHLTDPRLVCMRLERRPPGVGVAHSGRCVRAVRATLDGPPKAKLEQGLTGAVARRLRIATRQASNKLWGELVRIGTGVLGPSVLASPLAPMALRRAVAAHGTLVVTVCTTSSAYALGQKRATAPSACLNWLGSLRHSSYSGPVAIATGGRPPPALVAAAAHRGGQRSVRSGVWLLEDLERRIPRRPVMGSLQPADEMQTGVARGSSVLRGNQLRLMWCLTPSFISATCLH